MRQPSRHDSENPQDRTLLITGATSGLGKALALSAPPGRLFLPGRDIADLAVDRSKIVAWIRQEVPTVVINNAGFGLYGNATFLSTNEQMNMLEVNAAAVLELTIEAAKALRQAGKRGTILNVASAAAFFPYPSFAVYAASKAFVRSFSLALDAELAPHGIRVLVFSPGQIGTDFRRRASKGASERHDPWTMPVEKAAAAIWKQISSGKGEVIFDWKYRLGVFLGKLFPRPFVQRRLQAALRTRRSFQDI